MPGAEVGEAFLWRRWRGLGGSCYQTAGQRGWICAWTLPLHWPKAPRSGAGSPPPRSSASNITGSSGLFYFFKQIILLKLILAALGLPCCVQAFSSCSERGLLLVVHRFLIAVASLVEHGLWALGSGVLAPGL